MQDNQQTAVVPRASALAIMADRCSVDPAKLHLTLKNTVFKGASDDELLALVVTANIYQLNPFLKEIYAFPKKGGGIVPLVGFDGWVKIANRQPDYDGMDVEVFGDEKNPTHATCTIYLKGRSHPVKVTEYFTECHRNTDPWNQMPRRMMRNKVIIQAVRVAFGVAGIHDEDEAHDMAMRNVTPVAEPAEPLQVADALKAKRTRKEPPAVEVQAEPTPARQTVIYLGTEVQNGVQKDGKTPFVRFIVSYDNGMAECKAQTYSKTIVKPLDGLEPQAQIVLETSPAKREGDCDTITMLEVVGGAV